MHYIKLQAPPRQRLRVHEIATQVGVTNQALKEVLRELGEYAASVNSYVEVPVIRQVHERFGVTYDAQPQTRPQAQPPPLFGLTPPSPRAHRDNNPYVQTAKRARDVAIEHQQDLWDDPLRWRDRPQVEQPAMSEEQQWSSGAGRGASPTFEFLEWKMRGLSEVERDVWVAAGLPTNRASVAAEVRDAGLTPADLATTVEGWTLLEWIGRGASGISVARLLQRFNEASG